MNHESHSECSMPTHTVQIASVHDALNIEVVCLVFALVCVNAVVGKCIAFSIDDGALVHEKETSHGRSSNPNRVCSGWMCVRVSDFLANTSFNIACGSMCPVWFTLNPTHSSMAHLHWIYSCENVKNEKEMKLWAELMVYWKRAHTEATSFQRIQWAIGAYEWDYRNQ